MKFFNNKKYINQQILQAGFLVKIKRIPLMLAENAFMVMLLLIGLDMLIGGWLFYRYGYLAKQAPPEIQNLPSRFEQGAYDSVLDAWQKREVIFNSSVGENYKDPFK